MRESDCVKILQGDHAGQEGVISLIDGNDIFVMMAQGDPLICDKLNVVVIECKDEGGYTIDDDDDDELYESEDGDDDDFDDSDLNDDEDDEEY